MKGCRIPYSVAELAWLQENRQMPIADYHAAFAEQFGRTDVSAANLNALRKRKRWRTGRTGRFEPGQPARNKGQPCAPGQGGRHPNCIAAQFKKGSRNGIAAKVYQPIGTEQVRDGYLCRKVNDDMPLHRRWRAVHLINWESVHGPIPPGHCLKCLDGDRLNTNPANWKMVSRGTLARLNGGPHKKRLGFDQAHPEIRPAVMALAEFEQAVHEKAKG